MNQSMSCGGGAAADSTLANLFSIPNDDSFVSSSTEVVNKNAFLFRNIEEMQKQNQKLTRMLNEIRDKKQSEEKLELEMRTKEFNEKLSLAVKELEEMRHQREKQEQLFDEIRKQRDTYKHLLNSYSNNASAGVNNQLNATTAFFTTSTPGIESRTRKSMMERPPSEQFTIDMTTIDQNRIATAAGGNVDAMIFQAQQQKLTEATVSLEKLQQQFDKYQEEKVKNNR
jgi:hypothetical protein